MDFDNRAIVLDFGAHTVRLGLSGDQQPIANFRNVLVRPLSAPHKVVSLSSKTNNSEKKSGETIFGTPCFSKNNFSSSDCPYPKQLGLETLSVSVSEQGVSRTRDFASGSFFNHTGNVQTNKLKNSKLFFGGLHFANHPIDSSLKEDVIVHALECLKSSLSNQISSWSEDETGRLLSATPSFESATSRSHFLEFAFESLKLSNLSCLPQPVAAVLRRGVCSGMAVDIGESSSQVSYVSDGCLLMSSAFVTPIGGWELTSNLLMQIQRMSALKYSLGVKDLPFLEDMKRCLCFVSQNFTRDSKLAEDTFALTTCYSLPDGTAARINEARFGVPEVLFKPRLAFNNKSDAASLPEVIINSIMTLPLDLRLGALKSVICVGASTQLNGLQFRLANELSSSYYAHFEQQKVQKGGSGQENEESLNLPTVNASSMRTNIGAAEGTGRASVIIPDEPDKAVFTGASLTAEMALAGLLRDMWYSKQMYEECGPVRSVVVMRDRFLTQKI